MTAEGQGWVTVAAKEPAPPTVERIIAVGSKKLRDEQWAGHTGIELVRMFKELFAELTHRKADLEKVSRVANEIKRQVPDECPTPEDMKRMVFGIYEGGFAEIMPELLSPPAASWSSGVTTIPVMRPHSPGGPPSADDADDDLFS